MRISSDNHSFMGRNWIAVLALVVATLSLLLSFAQSPFSDLLRPKLEYAYQCENFANEKPDDPVAKAHMAGQVWNIGRIAARNVFVLIDANTDVSEIRCNDFSFEVLHAIQGEHLIRFDVLPPMAQIDISCETEITKPDPNATRPWGVPPWKDAPRIKRVYTEHGDAIPVNSKINETNVGYGLNID